MSRKNQPRDGVPQKEPESQGRVAAAQDGHPQSSSPVVPEPARQ